jgi:hypothetical protein
MKERYGEFPRKQIKKHRAKSDKASLNNGA